MDMMKQKANVFALARYTLDAYNRSTDRRSYMFTVEHCEVATTIDCCTIAIRVNKKQISISIVRTISQMNRN